MKVTGISNYSNNILIKYKKFEVFSHNSKAIYIRNKDNILSLQVDGTVLSPMSIVINIKDFNSLNHITHKSVYYDKNTLCIQENDERIKKIDFRINEFYESSIESTIEGFLGEKYYEKAMFFSRSIIYSKNTGGLNQIFIKDIKTNAFIMKFIEDRLHKIHRLFSNKDYRNGLILLSDSIGLGVGLTPSLDDFLTGFISANLVFGKIDNNNFSLFKQNIKQNINKTGPISRKFLYLALEGHFSKPIIDFYKALLNGSKDIKALEKEFSKVGSSSGIDSACGIYFYCINFLK